ncbi:MAG: hypothetical protein SFT68_05185, partial [Rickettsiaceae bacterium]|nr:hypothetical protein [Rickettsiaceae bacterium]
FNYTYKYFDKWWRVFLGMMLQATVTILFLAIYFSLYDLAFYGTCQYKSVDITLVNDSTSSSHIYKSFYISYDIADYASATALDSCYYSVGSFLNGASIFNYSPPTSVTIHTSNDFTSQIANTATQVFDGIARPKMSWNQGVFTKVPDLSWEDLVEVLKSFIVCYFIMSTMQSLLDILPEMSKKLSGVGALEGGAPMRGSVVYSSLHSRARGGVSKSTKFAQQAKQNLVTARKGLIGSAGKTVFRFGHKAFSPIRRALKYMIGGRNGNKEGQNQINTSSNSGDSE